MPCERPPQAVVLRVPDVTLEQAADVCDVLGRDVEAEAPPLDGGDM